jgi:sec-independent protein translocase protein TatB
MILLSPPKLLVILVIALIVLGPDKLPSTARRIGALWSDVKRWRAHLEGEVRASFPDLPSTTEIARAVRSPISMLDRLADEHGASADAGPVDPATRAPTHASASPASHSSAVSPAPPPPRAAQVDVSVDTDASMN